MTRLKFFGKWGQICKKEGIHVLFVENLKYRKWKGNENVGNNREEYDY